MLLIKTYFLFMLKNVVDLKKAFRVLLAKLKKLHPMQLGLVIFLTISAIVGVYLVQREIRLRLKAAVTTVSLYLSPSTASVPPSTTLDLNINTQGEQVGFVDLQGNFDPTMVKLTQEIQVIPQYWTVVQKTSMASANTTGSFRLVIAIGYNDSTPTPQPAPPLSGIANIAKLTFDQNTSNSNQTAVVSLSQSTEVYNMQSVLLGVQTTPANITVNPVSSARLFLTNPGTKTLNTQFTVSIYGDTAGQNVDGIDAIVNYNPAVLQAVTVVKGNEPRFTSTPRLTFNNTTGTAYISVNVGSGTSTTPVNGSNIHVGDIIFKGVAVSSGSQITFDFTPGGRNDSNMVLTGTWNTQDPVDILTSVNGTSVIITGSQTPTATPTVQPTVQPTAIPTQIPTATPTIQSNLNLALNKAVLASSSIENWGWFKTGAVDGNTSSSAAPFGWSSFSNLSVSHTEWITVDLGTNYTVGKVNLYPRNDVSNVGQGFPIDFAVQVSQNNSTWTTVANLTNYALPTSNVQSFSFTQVTARYVRINATKLRINASDNNYYFQLAEFEVYSQPGAIVSPTAVPPTSVPTATPTNVPPTATPTSVSATNTPSPSSVTLKIKMQGKLRTGVSNSANITVSYRKPNTTTITQTTATTNTAGEAILSIATGNYVFLIQTAGYLPRKYGSDTNPVVISTTNSYLDLSNPILLGGDFNGDGEINEIDYTLNMLPNYGTALSLVDLDRSGSINNLDYVIMRHNWNLLKDQL